MEKPLPTVFYFRGLSTHGRDDIRWSAFDVGPIHRELEKEFIHRGVRLIPVLGMGAGTWKDITTRAREFLRTHPVWQDSQTPVHLLGHSAGGVAMRLLLQEGLGRSQVLSALTLCAPHTGTKMARIFADMPSQRPVSAAMFAAVGNKIKGQEFIYEQLTPETVKALWTGTPKDIRLASVITTAPRNKWCWLLKACHSVPALRDFPDPSDGIIEAEAQAYGDVIAEIEIDHFRTAGLFNNGPAFSKQCDVMCDYFKKTNRI